RVHHAELADPARSGARVGRLRGGLPDRPRRSVSHAAAGRCRRVWHPGLAGVLERGPGGPCGYSPGLPRAGSAACCAAGRQSAAALGALNAAQTTPGDRVYSRHMQREYTPALRDAAFFIRKFRLEVMDGPERGRRVDSLSDELTIGSSPGNDLVLSDDSVS